MVIKIIDLFIGTLINIVFYILVLYKFFDLEYKQNKYTSNLLIILFTLLIVIINIYFKDIYKIFLTIPIITFLIDILFNLGIYKSLLYTIVIMFNLIISELVFRLIVLILPFVYLLIFTIKFEMVMSNIFIITLSIPLLFMKKITHKLILLVENINVQKVTLILYVLIFSIIICSIIFNNIRSNDAVFLITISLSTFFMFLTYVIYSISNESKLAMMSEEYLMTLKYLEDYEKEVIEKRKIIHNFKNELIVINGLLDNKKELKKYVSNLLDDYKQINEEVKFKNFSKLPHGIRGLVYFKFKSNNLNYNIDVQNKILFLNDINEKLNKEILKVFGIVLDNAIEASSKSNEKLLNITLFEDSYSLTIEISNTFDENIIEDKIDNLGYSTKGSERGYGLSIIQDTITKFKKINYSHKIINEVFISTITISK